MKSKYGLKAERDELEMKIKATIDEMKRYESYQKNLDAEYDQLKSMSIPDIIKDNSTWKPYFEADSDDNAESIKIKAINERKEEVRELNDDVINFNRNLLIQLKKDLDRINRLLKTASIVTAEIIYEPKITRTPPKKRIPPMKAKETMPQFTKKSKEMSPKKRSPPMEVKVSTNKKTKITKKVGFKNVHLSIIPINIATNKKFSHDQEIVIPENEERVIGRLTWPDIMKTFKEDATFVSRNSVKLSIKDGKVSVISMRKALPLIRVKIGKISVWKDINDGDEFFLEPGDKVALATTFVSTKGESKGIDFGFQVLNHSST